VGYSSPGAALVCATKCVCPLPAPILLQECQATSSALLLQGQAGRGRGSGCRRGGVRPLCSRNLFDFILTKGPPPCTGPSPARSAGAARGGARSAPQPLLSSCGVCVCVCACVCVAARVMVALLASAMAEVSCTEPKGLPSMQGARRRRMTKGGCLNPQRSGWVPGK